MTIVANLYLTHGVMLLSALAAAIVIVPESIGRIVRWWWPAMVALLAALSALALIAYPTWGDLKNPGLWMFAILAAVVGVARGYLLRVDVDQIWGLVRLQRSYDTFLAAVLLVALAAIEIMLANIGPADQPTMELGMTIAASYLVGLTAAVLFRARSEPHADLHDPSRPVHG